MEKKDYKKLQKELYLPKTTPGVIDVPEMLFFMVDGQGNPNNSPAYQRAIQLLYSLSFTVKMSKMGADIPDGYFEYVVPPLEGFWHIDGLNGMDYTRKDDFCWTSVIRQPEFVTDDVLAWAKAKAAIKNPELDFSKARLEKLTEGLCVQCMHIGPFDDEPQTIESMQQYMRQNGFVEDFSDTRRHHEIYLGDPRKTAPEKMKTVIRHPVRKG